MEEAKVQITFSESINAHTPVGKASLAALGCAKEVLTALEQRNLKGPQEMKIGPKQEIRLIWRDENRDGRYTTVLICNPGGALTTRVYNQAPSMAAAVDLVEDAVKEEGS